MVFDSKQSPDYTQKLQIKATGGTYSPTKEGFKVYICVWENYPYGPQTWYYHSLGGWLSRLKEEFTYVSPNEVGFTVKGKIASVNGKNMQCTVKQKPYLDQAHLKVTVIANEVGNTSNIVHEVESLEEIGKPDNVK